MSARLALVLILLAATAAMAETGLPLPPAPLRLVIPDAAAFDAALSGAYRRALTGEADEGDPVVAGWRRSQVGAKLEDQWSKLAGDLPWTWNEIQKLNPRAVGLALLDVGHLEAVLVADARVGVLPTALAKGEAATHGGVAYQVVRRGAADGSDDPDRRMGLAWAWLGSRLVVTTSERAMTLTLDQHLSGRGFEAPLPGLVSVDLDADALRKDRYFRREFVFGPDSVSGHVVAALRLENGQLVEVREGSGEAGSDGVSFEWPRAVAAAWEPDARDLAATLRAAVLEPLATLADRPVPAVSALPATKAAETDRYLVNLERTSAAAAPAEEGDLAAWRQIFDATSVSGWGYALGPEGGRRIGFPWPAARDEEVLNLCRATLARRAGPVTVAAVGAASEIRVGPGLPALALRRTGGFLWVAQSAAELGDAPTPTLSTGLVRWAKVDLEAARSEGARWNRVEGPAAPEQVRPFSDRILGLLGWMPETTSVQVERRRTPSGWTERVVFVPRGR
jgi:hypothetical protein